MNKDQDQQKLIGYFTLKYPKGIDLLIFHFFPVHWKQFLVFGLNLDLEVFKTMTLSPIRGSSVPGKITESWNMTACPVHLRGGVD